MKPIVSIGNQDPVTLITRPRRFGKTLNMSMIENFFSVSCEKIKSCLRGLRYGRKKNTGKSREAIRLFFSVLQL